MAALDTDSQDRHHPPLIITAIGILVVVVAIALNYVVFLPRTSDSPPVAAVVPATAPPSTPAAIRPAFHVVRVSATGDVVIAGTAGPGATVTVFSGEQPIGEVVADGRGEWVFLPDQPLPPGTHRLVLQQAAVGDGPAKSGETIVVVVPEPGGKRDAAYQVIYAAGRGQTGKADLMRRGHGSGVPAGP